jgi:hypothetical protein
MAIVVEMSQSSWLVAGVVPGLDRRPLKKVDPNPATFDLDRRENRSRRAYPSLVPLRSEMAWPGNPE